MGWQGKTERAKRLHRPSLKGNWERDDLYHTFESYLEKIQEKDNDFTTTHGFYCRECIYCNSNRNSSFPAKIEFDAVSPKEFIEDYESKRIPCVISGVTTSCSYGNRPWKANGNWNLEELLQCRALRHYRFKIGEDDDGKSLRMRLKHFLKYLHKNRDDSPLYVFDSNFDEDKKAKCLMEDFTVPPYFPQDLFSLVGERRRPPHRWFLIGPQRSGTSVHIDPLGSSAWNTLLHGLKRWVLFPPGTPKSIVKAKNYVKNREDDEPIHYFMKLLPRIKKRLRDTTHFHCYEFTQYAGDTVFLPQGWWHAVLNLTHTVAVTQNYVSERNFDEAWLSTRGGRKRMATKWLSLLQNDYPHLVERARKMDREDNFVLKYELMDQGNNKKKKRCRDMGEEEEEEASRKKKHNNKHKKRKKC